MIAWFLRRSGIGIMGSAYGTPPTCKGIFSMAPMILFPFVTQATEPAPGASIEEPRVRNTNLAA